MYLISSAIEALPDKTLDSKFDLKVPLNELATMQRIARNMCRIVIKHEKTKCEDGRDFFTVKQWKELHGRCGGAKFSTERLAIEKGRKFGTAYSTDMGVEIQEVLLRCIQNGYETIAKGNIDMEGLYEMNVHRLVLARWDSKILAYKKNIERVKKIIYKEN